MSKTQAAHWITLPIVLATTFVLASTSAKAAILLRAEKFDAENPIAGQPIELRLIIDADPNLTGDQPVPNGLLNVAVRLAFPVHAFIINDIIPKAQLDHLGAGQDAFRDIDPANISAGFRGNTAIESPRPGFPGTLLAYVEVTPTTIGTFNLSPGPFDPGASDNFIDGAGAPLDAQIQFVPLTVTVVPEPAATALCCIAITCLTRRPRRSKPAPA